MIWHNETLEVPNQPAGATVALVGQFLLNDSTPPISLSLEFRAHPDDALTKIILFKHQPSGVMTEDPSPDDILNRYRGKIIKARNRITLTPFEALASVKPVV